MALVCRVSLVAAQGSQMAAEAPDHGKIRHFPVRADGACSGPVQQLSGMVEAAPALTGRPMTLVWRYGAPVTVLGRVPGQEFPIPLVIHSETRAPGLGR